MAPRGRKKIGLMREDAARDAMIEFGFEMRVINETIKELLELYGEDAWKLIEDGGYDVLLNRCLVNQEEQDKKLANEEEHDEELAEEEEEEEEEQYQHVEEGRVSSSMDSSPTIFQSGEASTVGGANSSHCGWLSGEEETDPDEDGDEDDEMIHLTPEPLCEQLEELLREIRGQRNRKMSSTRSVSSIVRRVS